MSNDELMAGLAWLQHGKRSQNAVVCAVLSAVTGSTYCALFPLGTGDATPRFPIFSTLVIRLSSLYQFVSASCAVALVKADSWLTNEDSWDHRWPWAGKHGRLLPKDHRALSGAHRRRELSGIYHQQCQFAEGPRFHGHGRPHRHGRLLASGDRQTCARRRRFRSDLGEYASYCLRRGRVEVADSFDQSR